MPAMLAAVVKNRFRFATLPIVELGSVFEPGANGGLEHRHIGLITARRAKKAENDLLLELKAAIESWAWTHFTAPVTFGAANADTARPWESPDRTATVEIAGRNVGKVSVVEMAPRRAMDEHLAAWSIAWAEIRLSGLEEIDAPAERLGTIPPYPRVELDFSITAPMTVAYREVADKLRAFEHALLKRVTYVGSYEGKSVGQGLRSLTFRVVLSHDQRTLVDEDAGGFAATFEGYVKKCGYQLRK